MINKIEDIILAKELYNSYIKELLDKLKEWNSKEYIINEYERVIIFNNTHTIYVAIKEKDMTFINIPKYIPKDEHIFWKYELIIQELVLDDNFTFNNYKQLLKSKNIPPFFINHNKTNPYLFEIEKDEFFNYISTSLPEINLLKRYYDNQEDRNIETDSNFISALVYYDIVYNKYIEEISNYNYKELIINNHEKVLIIEDTFIIYIGLKGKAPSLFKNCNYNRTFFDENYIIVFQELSYNDLWKFNLTKFRNNFDGIFENIYGIFIYNFFCGEKEMPLCNIQNEPIPIEMISNFNYVDKKLPELQLLNRYNNWSGRLYYFIVYELKIDGKLGILVTHTTQTLPTTIVNSKITEIETELTLNYLYSQTDTFKIKEEKWLKMAYNVEMPQNYISLINEAEKENWKYAKERIIDYKFPKVHYHLEKFVKDNNKSNFENWKHIKKNLGHYSLLSGNIKYYFVEKYIKKTSEITLYQEEILKNAQMGFYDNYERQEYNITEYRWKSEELMLNCIKEVFKQNKIIHQHRPYFLHTTTGQLSYDVFVCGKNIAFEYQGKQHFEPVEIFGGKENFDKQVLRDKLKMELSKKNGITLIYINYWENISVDLIKQKIKECQDIAFL